MEGNQIFYSLKHPFRALFISSSGCGKTTLALQLLANRKNIIDTDIKKIYYVYVHDQPIFDVYRKSHPEIEFIKNIDDLETLITGQEDTLLVLDDLMIDFCTKKGSAYLADWFTRRSRHFKCSVIVLLHSAFPENLRVCSLNTSYTVFFDTPRDRSTITYIQRQMYPGKQNQLVDAFYDAISIKHGHLVLDHTPQTDEKLRVRNFILPRQKDMKYYVIK